MGGHSDSDQWTTTYVLQPNDDTTFFQQGDLFTGNADRSTFNENLLTTRISARYLRLLPAARSGHMSLRAYVLGTQDAAGVAFGLYRQASDGSWTHWDYEITQCAAEG